MKYIIDLDALKECLNLLPKPIRNGNLEYVCLQAVKEMIDKFPKDVVHPLKQLTEDEFREKYCAICPNWGNNDTNKKCYKCIGLFE